MVIDENANSELSFSLPVESKTVLIACVYVYQEWRAISRLFPCVRAIYIDVFLLQLKHAFSFQSEKAFWSHSGKASLSSFTMSHIAVALRNSFPTSKGPLEEENPFYIGSADRERRSWHCVISFRYLSNVERSTSAALTRMISRVAKLPYSTKKEECL